MPKLQLTPREAEALKRRRANNAKFNAGVTACIKLVQRQMQGADPLATAVLDVAARNLRKLIKV